ncbi:NPFFR2 [Mytilus coruscus]|uniref:NPFFR2 n=1 Tax=Mytilus coruscus TaxID=42192 RepID=A0A6J8BNW3_MYTCO|nr:NPFFR2 [Mytilus coruscus]
MENTQEFFISVQAVSDITSILLRTTLVILQNTNMTDKYSALCKARSFIFGLPSGISSFLLVAIALDRYLRICKNNSMCSKWRGRVIIVVISVAFIGVLPKLFIADIVKIQKNSSDNYTASVCKISDEDKIRYCLPVLVLCIGIAAVLVILYGRIILTLNAHFKRIKNSLTTAEISGNLENNNVQNEPKSELSRRNILIMKKTISIFIAISVTFFFSYIPFLIT